MRKLLFLLLLGPGFLQLVTSKVTCEFVTLLS